MISEREVSMSTTTSEILESFDHLAEDEKREVASEILRRTIELELPPLTDDELVFNAEALFLELDQRELTKYLTRLAGSPSPSSHLS
jgi:hypothetical protein